MTKYTPGPWVASRSLAGDWEIWTEGNRRVNLTTSACVRIATVTEHHAEDFSAKDTATLIAAAPEMLTVLRQCQTELEEVVKLLMPQFRGVAGIYLAAALRVADVIARATA